MISYKKLTRMRQREKKIENMEEQLKEGRMRSSNMHLIRVQKGKEGGNRSEATI